jgi:autoinducer 2 (AI-2) kinase
MDTPKLVAYLIFDVGTGNVRVAVATPDGELLCVQTEDMVYIKDHNYVDALYFEPDSLWKQLIRLARRTLDLCGNPEILAISATSQREGIILIDHEGHALIGLPNIDHRGREWEDTIADKNRMYALTGRYPSSLFSAIKLIGLRQANSGFWPMTSSFMSISDWIEYVLSGVLHYEHSQASETLLYDVERKAWSDELCNDFNIDRTLLPSLVSSGTILGKIKENEAGLLGLSVNAAIIVGGADTQLGVLGSEAGTGDVVLISGTTTPIVKLTDQYVLDGKSRTWTSNHIDGKRYMLEANAGVTGLNYQNLKAIFYPNESYDLMEEELGRVSGRNCVAALGSLVAGEQKPLIRGGFAFDTPVAAGLNRADFVWAIVWDMACSIVANYKTLCEISAHEKNYVLACGGGFQSLTLRQVIATLLGKKVILRSGYPQASVIGAIWLCNNALGHEQKVNTGSEEVSPQTVVQYFEQYKVWENVRESFKKF